MGHGPSKREREAIRRSYRLESDELKSWVRVFNRYTKRTGDTEIDLKGFKRAFANTDESPAELENIFRHFDVDDNGTISFCEFMFAVLINSRVSTRAKLKFAFDMIDTNGNGSIDEDELMDLVSHVSSAKSKLMFGDDAQVRAQLVRRTFRDMDTNGDGEISLEEFVEQVEKHGPWILKLFDIHL